MSISRRIIVLFSLFALLLPHLAQARIKLITLPVRERVEIQLDHPNVTLVEEERIVPVVEGVNQVDFSWANTRIDSDTLVFRVMAPADGAANELEVLSVSYPPNENALIWNVAAARSGAARVRISYVLGGLEKSFAYRAVAEHDESTLDLSQYLRLANYANEEYDASGIWAGFGERQEKTVGLGETKQVLMQRYQGVPVRKTYTCDPQVHGYLDRPQNKLRVPMHYVLKNDQANQLGLAALPYGKVRIFQDDGKGGTAFIGEDWGDFTPLDDELELYLGVAQDIVVKRTVDKNEQIRVAGNLYHYSIVLKFEIENFKDKPVTLDIRENVRAIRDELRGNNGREVEWEILPATTLGDLDKDKSTHQELLFHVDLPARKADGKAEKIEHKLALQFRNEWR